MRKTGVSRWVATDLATVASRLGVLSKELAGEGVIGADFERAVMFDVDPRDMDSMLASMHRRGMVWVGRNRGAVRVFAKRPARIAREMPLALEPIDAFLGAVLPHLRRMRIAATPYAMGVEAGRVANLVHRHAGKGVSLKAMREELWSMFPASVVELVAYHEPRMQRESTAADIESPPGRLKRIGNNLPLAERIAALAIKSGELGVTKTDLARAIRPRIAAAEIEKALQGLEAEGRLHSGRVAGRGRPALRWWVRA